MSPRKKQTPELTVLSAFTGPGGLDLGLETAGFSTIGCIEIDETARKTIAANRDWPLLEPGDIAKLSCTLGPASLGLRPRELGVLAGGPPCQPFSKAGQWSANGARGLIDPRSSCLSSFFAVLESFLPAVLLVENVPGFVRGKTSVLAHVQDALSRINREHETEYCLDARIINAVDYGVPQRRERVILIARRDGRSFQWPEATHAASPVRAWDALHDLAAESVPPVRGRWAGLLPSIPEGWNYQWHTDRGGGEPIFGYRTRYWSFLLKLAKVLPSWTVSAQPGPATGPFHWENRPLAVQEMLRLQSFPATWKVRGDYRRQVMQVGNATPPLLAEILGREIGKQVFRRKPSATPKLAISQASSVPGPCKPQGVPEAYLGLAGRHEPHPGTGKGPRPVSITREA